jgi:hypothetical protein
MPERMSLEHHCVQISGGEEINWELYWNPKLSILNGFGELKDVVWRSVSFDRKGEATVSEKRRVSGSFTEYMELNQFPFDTQVRAELH